MIKKHQKHIYICDLRNNFLKQLLRKPSNLPKKIHICEKIGVDKVFQIFVQSDE